MGYFGGGCGEEVGWEIGGGGSGGGCGEGVVGLFRGGRGELGARWRIDLMGSLLRIDMVIVGLVCTLDLPVDAGVAQEMC